MDYDDAYANAAYIPGADSFIQRWQADAEAFRQRMSVMRRARLGLMYGHGTRNAFDLFHPDVSSKGLVIFVHGGYWLRFDRSYWSHFAQGALDHGWSVAMPSYDLCPRVRIRDITMQVAHAVCAAAHEVDGPIRLAGHSAGGHLVARMTQKFLLPDDVAERMEHVMPISPVSDLRPLLHTKMNADFQMDEGDAAAESPVLMDKPAVPVTVWVGADERPAFLDQARWLGNAWDAQVQVEHGKHHFDVIDGLKDAQSPMMQALMS